MRKWEIKRKIIIMKKIMWLVRVLALVQFWWFADCVSLTYILKREGEHLQPSCIAEGLERYAAVGWIYPVSDDGSGIPNTTTRYIPSIQTDYNCKFSKNDKCNGRWTVKDWQIDETSSKVREFIDDDRWEDLPIIPISKSTLEFERRFHLENATKVGFSVRASGYVELFFCTGWNPRNYPCYYFRIEQQEIYFTKLAALADDLDFKTAQLEYSKTASNILANDEWRSFEVSMSNNGNISFLDKNNADRLLINHMDEEPIKPLYMLMRSSDLSFWKIMENYFMYTETTQISRIGPQYLSSYKDLCISLLVATCSYCEITFFYMKGKNREILKHVPPTDDKWLEIKLKQENFSLNRFNLFVETKYLNNSEGAASGWWAVDNIRVCNENEIKVTYLKLNQTFAEDDTTVNGISCQLIKQPNFRPQSLEYDQIEDFPPVNSATNDTSIHLKWAEEDPDHYLTYFVYYQGLDRCSSDIATSQRLMSGGFLTTKHNEITIPNLIPYTRYNVTLSSVLHEKDKYLYISTLETEEPRFEELPISLHIRPRDSAVNVTWDKPQCNTTYGRLIYNITVSNEKFNFSKSLDFQTKNSYYIEGLRPFMKHNLTIATARNARNLIKGAHVQILSNEFTTLPGVAPPIRNVEVYSAGLTTAHIRYDLPTNPQGIPSEVEVIRCNVLSRAKCKSSISSISRCTLWPKKLCIDVDYLMPNQNYTLKVSVKNANSNAFGKSVQIVTESTERVPAPPENVTYQVVDCRESTDYCHLNISWMHPYNPNGTIDAFNIILNTTYFNTSYSEEDQAIHEVYKIANESYLPQYTYQVKYVPYSQEYNLYLQSANTKYKSNYVVTTVKTADLGDHIDQSPKLLGKGDKAIVFRLPPLDRRLESYTLTVAVQDYNESIPVYVDSIKNKKLADNICHPYGLTWIAQTLKIKNNDTKTVTITGIDSKRLIKPDTKYCIIFIITNNYRGEEHDVVYYEKLTTPSTAPPSNDAPKTGSFNHLYMLLLLLLVIPIAFAIYWFIKRRNSRKPRQSNNENVYESLPFEEQDGRNFASNRTYDQLIHK